LVAYFSAPVFDRTVHLIALVNWTLALLMLVVGLGFLGWLLWRAVIQHGKG